MRLGVVERGNYKTKEYEDLTGYQMEVNGFCYDFGRILSETRLRFKELWGIECPPDLLKKRLHFSEERFFNRMLKNEHYGVYHRNTGANICLGLLPEEQTCNLVIHELAHEMHYRHGGYNRAEVVVQELVAIMAEEEYETRQFDFDPHYTSQQLLHQLMEQPAFASLPFSERWQIVADIGTLAQVSFLINRYLDDTDGHHLRTWLSSRCANPEQARAITNALASVSECYAIFNRRLLIKRLLNIRGSAILPAQDIDAICRALYQLKALDQHNPHDSLSNLIYSAFGDL